MSRKATVPKHVQAAAIVRAQIQAGALRAGQPAPSGAELHRATGFAQLTCRRALDDLVAEGVLVPGHSPGARPRIAGPGDRAAVTMAGRALSAGLAQRRAAAGLTQPELGLLVGKSVTTVGHAETGRLWQSREFWEMADKVLDAGGKLIRLHDAYRAAAPDGAPLSGSGGVPAGVKRTMVIAVILVWDNGEVTTMTPDEAREHFAG